MLFGTIKETVIQAWVRISLSLQNGWPTLFWCFTLLSGAVQMVRQLVLNPVINGQSTSPLFNQRWKLMNWWIAMGRVWICLCVPELIVPYWTERAVGFH